MKYIRVSFEVEALQYEVGKNIEDGCESWSDVVIHGRSEEHTSELQSQR